MKGLYQYLRESWKKKTAADNIKKWRKGRVVQRVNKPSRLDRAHSLGYKAKQGFVIVRVRIPKGGRRRPKRRKGRKQTKVGLKKYTTKQSLQSIAEKRAARKYPNLEVLNSYHVGEDGQYKFYEIIMIDTKHGAIIKDKTAGRICRQRRRVFRGLTSAGKKTRK